LSFLANSAKTEITVDNKRMRDFIFGFQVSGFRCQSAGDSLKPET
jgi:hypothetical protein